MRCQICGTELNGCLCPRCGFDLSRCRELFPTLADDGRKPETIGTQREGSQRRPPRKRSLLPLWLSLGGLALLAAAGFFFLRPQGTEQAPAGSVGTGEQLVTGGGETASRAEAEEEETDWLWVVVEEASRSDDGIGDYTQLFEYDSTGRLSKRTSLNKDGSVKDWYEYACVYNSDNRLIQETAYYFMENYYQGGEYRNVTYYVYNPDGTLKTSSTDLWIGTTTQHEYSYHPDGTLAEDTECFDGDYWTTLYEYDSDGTLLKTVNHSFNEIFEFEYDDSGRLIGKKQYDEESDGSGELRFCYTCLYDDNGNKTEEITYSAEGEERERKTWKYERLRVTKPTETPAEEEPDAALHKWVLIRESTREPTSREADSWISYEYSDDGLKTNATSYDKDGQILSRQSFEYDETGILTKETAYAADNSLSSRTEYLYGTDLRLINRSEYNPDGSLFKWYEYSYSEDGALEAVSCYSTEYGFSNQEAFHYDPDGRLAYTTSYWGDAVVGDLHRFSYDADGHLIREGVYYPESQEDETLTEWYGYEYDANGNLLRKTTYNPTGYFLERVDYEYLDLNHE